MDEFILRILSSLFDMENNSFWLLQGLIRQKVLIASILDLGFFFGVLFSSKDKFLLEWISVEAIE
jgi:hypothetical protein